MPELRETLLNISYSAPDVCISFTILDIHAAKITEFIDQFYGLFYNLYIFMAMTVHSRFFGLLGLIPGLLLWLMPASLPTLLACL